MKEQATPLSGGEAFKQGGTDEKGLRQDCAPLAHKEQGSQSGWNRVNERESSRR